MFTRKPNVDSGPAPRKGAVAPDVTSNIPPPLATQPRASSVEPPRDVMPQFEEGLVVIGRGTRVNGRITDCRVLDVHGIIEADVVAEKLIVREGGGIKGVVQTDNAEVHGVVEGTLTVHEFLDIRRTAHVTGDVEYRRLAIEAGAQVRGSILCSESPEPITPAEEMEGLDRTVVSLSGMATHHNRTQSNGSQHNGSQHHAGGGHPNLQSFMPISTSSAGSEKAWRQPH